MLIIYSVQLCATPWLRVKMSSLLKKGDISNTFPVFIYPLLILLPTFSVSFIFLVYRYSALYGS